MTLKVTKKRLGTSESLTIYTYPKIPPKKSYISKSYAAKKFNPFFQTKKKGYFFPALLKAIIVAFFLVVYPISAPYTTKKGLRQRVRKFCEVFGEMSFDF